MNSCFYIGRVRHRRFSPRHHEFDYRLFYVYLDLDELDFVFKNRWFWSTQSWALARFKREDYLGDATKTLRESVQQCVKNEFGEIPSGPIRMLTHLRYFGYIFNPVTFYYCFDETGENIEYIVAEITNTPWGERHTYVLQNKTAEEHSSKNLHHLLKKQFHISPFMPMNIDYDWRFSNPDQRLNVHMVNHHDGEKIFDATLQMNKEAITARSCAYLLVAFPFMTAKVIIGIYWQALRLFLKRTPIFTHPAKLYEQLRNLK